ncbi:MAG: hypothetical protein JWQ71_1908 [Pedosphaera sp.]|nr:hypothetical protein [Pedosphaera sp.]
MRSKINIRQQKSCRPKTTKLSFPRCLAAIAALALGVAGNLLPSANAAPVTHGISAADITVVQNDTGNTAASVTCTTSNAINDFRIRVGSNRGDFNIQIGADPADDITNGVFMSCITQNGRDNGEGTGVQFSTSAIDYDRNTGAAYIPVFSVGTGLPEYNVNVAGAYFPLDKWLGGFARNSTTPPVNGGTNDLFTGSPQLELGTHFVGIANGRSTVNLTNLGINSQVDGVLLVTGGKNEANYALSLANADGTWTVFVHDDNANAGSYEQDPVAFVYIPKTNNTVVSGKFLGDGAPAIFSGATPQFTATAVSAGTYQLEIANHSSADGVLIISAEGGTALNSDNIVTCQPNGTGWRIQSRDLPNTTGVPGLQSPPATEAVISFVFIPAPTPGFSVTPTNNLQTTESGGTATFSVVLDTQPTADVTINVSSSNVNEGTVDPASLTFTVDDWNIPHVVTITGADDALTDGPVAYTIVLSPATSADANYNNVDPVDVAVVNADNEAGVTVTPTSGLVTTEAGGTATFTVQLNTQPAADVVIGLSSSKLGEGSVAPASLTFNSANWNTPQTVTVTGVDDFVADGNVAYTIITAPSTSADPLYNGLNAADVSALNIDNDIAGIIVSPTNGLSVAETGSTANFTVVLTSQPTANVVVNLSSADTTEGTVSPASLTFAPADWSTPKTATITGVDDFVNDGNIIFSIITAVSSTDGNYAAINPPDVTVTNVDNESSLTLPSGTVVYGSGTIAVGIDGQAIITSNGSPDYAGGSFTVSLTANGTSDDRLEIRSTGTAAGQISTSGGTVSYSGGVIGNFAGGVGTAPLVITFSGAVTPDAAQALLRAVTFRNVNSNPSVNPRTLSVALADGDGGTSSATKTIRVGLLRQTQFQEGTDWGYGPYAGSADIQLHEQVPDTAYPLGNNTNNGIWINWPDSGVNNTSQGLLRFQNIFGTNPGQIPPGSTIVTADLILDVNDGGDGSPLYRMLVPWDATNETWNSFAAVNGLGGVQTDDNEARSTFDSQIGLVDGSGATGTGSVTISVIPDIQAWMLGETNCGWVFPGWPFQPDGTGVSTTKAPVPSDRPRLRVSWLPPGTAVASFRQGVNGYTGAKDTAIHQNAPNTAFAANATIFSDGAAFATSDESQVLMRFDDLVGSNPGQIPTGSQIHAAIIDLASVGNSAMGDGGRFFSMLEPWDDTTATWNSFTTGIQPNGVEAAATATVTAGSATLNPAVQGAFLTFEVTSDVQSWVSGSRTNYGWVIIPWLGGSDGWGFNTAEAAEERTRPQLRVYYSTVTANNITMLPLVWSPSNVQVRFTGTIGNTYSIQRSSAVDGSWVTIGTAVVAPNGTGTFSDNSPLTSKAFYRVSNP